MSQIRNSKQGFTLIEVLIAVSIFATVSTIVASLYIQSFKETRRANLHNQIYEDARFIMARIADEVRQNAIDYDEYFNQSVVLNTLGIPNAVDIKNYGQNYGRYYSSFYNPGDDNDLGFDCNDAPLSSHIGTDARSARRNQPECVPLRRTIDRNTGRNPYIGKRSDAFAEQENAFCATVMYSRGAGISNTGIAPVTTIPLCGVGGAPNEDVIRDSIEELYLISPNGSQKTVLAREKISDTDPTAYVLSLLRLSGTDTNNDGVYDKFVCSGEFQCRGDYNVPLITTSPVTDAACSATGDLPGELPRNERVDLTEGVDNCDPASGGFSKDFVPISPLRAKITNLKFIISPLEDPRYAFSETGWQPKVTVILTVEYNPAYTGVIDSFEPITLVQTISSRVLQRVPAPLLTR